MREHVGSSLSRSEIKALLRQHRASSLSLLAFAQQHHLPYPALWRWRRHLAARPRPSQPRPSSPSSSSPHARWPTSSSPGLPTAPSASHGASTPPTSKPSPTSRGCNGVRSWAFPFGQGKASLDSLLGTRLSMRPPASWVQPSNVRGGPEGIGAVLQRGGGHAGQDRDGLATFSA